MGPWSHCWEGQLGQALRKEGVRDVLGKGKPAVGGLCTHSPEEGGRGRSGGLASAASGWPSWECPALLLAAQSPVLPPCSCQTQFLLLMETTWSYSHFMSWLFSVPLLPAAHTKQLNCLKIGPPGSIYLFIL